MEIIHVVIADDYLVTIEGMAARLRESSSILIAGFLLGSDNLLTFLKEKRIDIVLIGADMSGCAAAISIILKKYPQVKVITMTFTINDDYLRLLLNHAPHGSVMKDDDSGTLKEAITQVYQYGFFYQPGLEKRLHEYGQKKSIFEMEVTLTPRDIEILRLIEKGLSHKEIASQLRVRKSTVNSHCKNIYGKLGVHKAQQAINEARRLRFLP